MNATGAGRVQGTVALVTGAARGQGRSHALRLAQEGAHLILLDAAAPISTIEYAMPTADDLDAVAKAVEALDRRAVVIQADVRDADGIGPAVAAAVEELGRLDTVVANAGVLGPGRRV